MAGEWGEKIGREEEGGRRDDGRGRRGEEDR